MVWAALYIVHSEPAGLADSSTVLTAYLRDLSGLGLTGILLDRRIP